jgi:RIO-like serine/threonine protein kinase
MFWTPIVKITGEKAKYQAERDLRHLEKYLERKHKIKIELIYNEKYYNCYKEIKQYSTKLNEHVDNFPLRFLQIIEKLEKYLNYLNKIGK